MEANLSIIISGRSSPQPLWVLEYTPLNIMWKDFEPIVEDGDSISSSEIERYEQYSRQEIPRLFRSALEAAANEEAVIIEGRLRDRLVDIIRLCQDQAFANYSNYRLSNASSTAIPEPYIEPMVSQTVEEATLLPSSVFLEPPSPRAVRTLENDLMHEWDCIWLQDAKWREWSINIWLNISRK